MLARLVDNKWIYLEQITTAEETVLWDAFSVRHPRHQYIDTSTGFFDGYYRKYNRYHKRLARPFLRDLIRICDERGLPLQVVDSRPAPSYSGPDMSLVTRDMLEGITLDDNQIEAIRAACKNGVLDEIGIISSPTGTGKCVTAESKILMNNLEIKIAELFGDFIDEEVKDVRGFGLEVLGPNGYKPVTSLYKTGPREIFKLVLNNGNILRGVAGHRVFTKHGWKKLQDLVGSDYVQVHPRSRIEISDKWSDYPQINEEVGSQAARADTIDGSYRIRLYELRETIQQGTETVYPDGDSTWRTDVHPLCEIYKFEEVDARPSDSSEIIRRLGDHATKCYEGSGGSCESDGNVSQEIWQCGSGQHSKCGPQGYGTQSASHQDDDGLWPSCTTSDREIQSDDGLKECARNHSYKTEAHCHLETESCYGPINKCIVYTCPEDTHDSYRVEIRQDSLSEQVRNTICAVMREIDRHIESTQRPHDTLCEFMVYFRFPSECADWRIYSGDQIKIFIRDERGNSIDQNGSGGGLCQEEQYAISTYYLRQEEQYGFSCEGASWSKVKSLSHDGIENCYDIQINDASHAYWTNNILSHNTEMMAGVTKAHNCPTVILCDMTVIVEQIKDRLLLEKAVEEVGIFYAGKRPNGQSVIIGSFQSLVVPSEPKKLKKDTPETWDRKMRAYRTRRTNAGKLRDIIGKCELLLVDECDNATGQEWRKLFTFWYKGRRKFGFSGTPFDPDRPVQALFLREFLGSIIYQAGRRKELEDNKRIIPITYTAMAFGDEKLIHEKSAFDIAQKEHIIENPVFHKLVKQLALKSISKDPTNGVLILVESKLLGYALEQFIEGSKFICGDHAMADRKKAIKSFEDRETRILIGGKIVKRGLDLKGGCEALIIATGGKMASDLKQKIGRAVRVNKKGIALIYDFFFLCNHYLYAHSRRRLKTVVEMGYPARVVFKNGVVDAEKFIKSRFRRPKSK